MMTERVLWVGGMRNSTSSPQPGVVVVGAAFSRDQFGDEKKNQLQEDLEFRILNAE